MREVLSVHVLDDRTLSVYLGSGAEEQRCADCGTSDPIHIPTIP